MAKNEEKAEFFHAMANDALRASEASELGQVKLRHAMSAAVWLELAVREEGRAERLRTGANRAMKSVTNSRAPCTT